MLRPFLSHNLKNKTCLLCLISDLILPIDCGCHELGGLSRAIFCNQTTVSIQIMYYPIDVYTLYIDLKMGSYNCLCIILNLYFKKVYKVLIYSIQPLFTLSAINIPHI